MIRFPVLYLKFPLQNEKINIKNKFYLARTKIEVCVYKIEERNYSTIISKDILYKDGQFETILLSYDKNLKDLDEVDDCIERTMNLQKAATI